MIKRITEKVARKLASRIECCLIPKTQYQSIQKYEEELKHWKNSLKSYQEWYRHEISEFYGEPAPSDEEKIKEHSELVNAIFTWQKNHQRVKYLEDLELLESAFENQNILDIGSGPHPSALAYKNCNVFCLDPLLPDYMKIGFPFHLYDSRVRFVYGFSEHVPFEDNTFDAIISVNALDHVDDFGKTAEEIRRVLKPTGKLRMHLHYHLKTPTEPMELNDTIIGNHYSWCEGFKKIRESKSKRGFELVNNESYTLWSNF